MLCSILHFVTFLAMRDRDHHYCDALEYILFNWQKLRKETFWTVLVFERMVAVKRIIGFFSDSIECIFSHQCSLFNAL